MNMQQWNRLIKTLGFTDSEVKIYLQSLEIGPSTVQNLARRVGVSRMTTYTVIESLTKHGLMSSIQKEKKTLYIAEPPERLVAFVQKKMTHMEETLLSVKTAIQELKLLQKGDKPIVKMFEGEEALKAIQEDLVTSKPEKIDEFGNRDELLKLYSLEEKLRSTYKNIESTKAERRMIYLTEDSGPTTRDEKSHRITLSPKEYNFTGDLLVYGNKVAISTLKGKHISILIENREIAQTIRSLFDLLWNKAKKSPSR